MTFGHRLFRLGLINKRSSRSGARLNISARFVPVTVTSCVSKPTCTFPELESETKTVCMSVSRVVVQTGRSFRTNPNGTVGRVKALT